MKRNILCLATVIALFATSSPVFAQTVTIEGEKCPLTIFATLDSLSSAEGQEAESETESIDAQENIVEESREAETGEEVKADTLEVYGCADVNAVAVKVGEKTGYVKKDELLAKLPEINLNILPDVTGTDVIGPGSSGAFVQMLQENLVALKYLEDTADGYYGNNTANAISAFQTEQGMEATGTADAVLQLMIAEAVNPSEEINTIYPMVYTVDKKFKEIYENTDADLEQYLDTAYGFSFDKKADQGIITTGQVLAKYDSPEGTPDIDQISFTVEYEILVGKNAETEKYELQPVLILNSAGIFRPYVTGIVLNSEDESITLEEVTLSGNLEGTKVSEEAVITLTEEAKEMLDEEKVESMQVVGRNQSWDF